MAQLPTFDETSIAAAVAGDRDAIARLIVFHAPQLKARISKRVCFNPINEFGVEDVLQEVFTDVLNGISSFEIGVGPPIGAWLNKVADNRLASMIRHSKQKKRGGEYARIDQVNDRFGDSVRLLVETIAAEGDLTPSELLQRDELVEAVREVLAEMPPAQRDALQAYYLDGNSLNTAANELKKPLGAIRGLVYRAKLKMRKLIGNTSRWFHKK